VKVSLFCTKAAAHSRPSTVRRCCCRNCVRGWSSSRAKPVLGDPAARTANTRGTKSTRINMIATKTNRTKLLTTPGCAQHASTACRNIEENNWQNTSDIRFEIACKTNTHLGMLTPAMLFTGNERRSSPTSPPTLLTRSSILRPCPRFRWPSPRKPEKNN
jgi:hypothetical protein